MANEVLKVNAAGTGWEKSTIPSDTTMIYKADGTGTTAGGKAESHIPLLITSEVIL